MKTDRILMYDLFCQDWNRNGRRYIADKIVAIHSSSHIKFQYKRRKNVEWRVC